MLVANYEHELSVNREHIVGNNSNHPNTSKNKKVDLENKLVIKNKVDDKDNNHKEKLAKENKNNESNLISTAI